MKNASSPARTRGSRRREFLLAAGAGGAAAVTALAARIGGTNPSSEGSDRSGASGYRVSEHVRNYYRSAKV